MIIEIDLTTAPPRTTLLEGDDFTAFSVVVRQAGHAWVTPASLAELAGPERAGDPAWRAQLGGMVDYAAGHGWVDADGRLRAHLTTTQPQDGGAG